MDVTRFLLDTWFCLVIWLVFLLRALDLALLLFAVVYQAHAL